MDLSSHLLDYHLRALAHPCTTKDRARFTGAEVLEGNFYPRHCSVVAILFDEESLAEFDGPAWYVISCRQTSSVNVRRLQRMSPWYRDKLEAWTRNVLGPNVGDVTRERIMPVSQQEIALIRPAREEEFAGTRAESLPRHIAERWWGQGAGFLPPGALPRDPNREEPC